MTKAGYITHLSHEPKVFWNNFVNFLCLCCRNASWIDVITRQNICRNGKACSEALKFVSDFNTFIITVQNSQYNIKAIKMINSTLKWYTSDMQINIIIELWKVIPIDILLTFCKLLPINEFTNYMQYGNCRIKNNASMIILSTNPNTFTYD